MKTEPVEIPFSKSKLTLLFVGSLAFVAIGFWLIINPPVVNHGLFSNPNLVIALGVVAMLFFGLCAIVLLKKLADKRPALVIDSSGLTDNVSAVSAGFVPWSDISEIRAAQVMSQKFLLIMVSNPEQYINRQSNAWKRKLATMNFENYGSPISISSNSLKCSVSELENMLQTQLNQNR